MDCIQLEQIRLYSNHGCLAEEEAIGSEYEVNVSVWADLSEASLNDNLSATVDYVDINKIVEQEVAIRSKLIEHVALRIIERIFKDLPQVKQTEVKLSKITPPINGDVKKVSIILNRKR